jgi:putative oxidoreductase
MDIMIFTGTLLFGGLLNFIKEVDIKSARRIAGVYIFIALVASIYTWINYFVFVSIKDTDLLKVLSVSLKIINIIAHIILGYLISYIILNFQQQNYQPDNESSKKVIYLTRWAISILLANTFIIATAGKSHAMGYMLDFFRQSGYANWFLYFIMTAEPLGALGILLHNKLKTGPLATCGLTMIMLGAVYTHLNNHDPFSDSYAAVIQLINLSLLLFLYYFETHINKKKP